VRVVRLTTGNAQASARGRRVDPDARQDLLSAAPRPGRRRRWSSSKGSRLDLDGVDEPADDLVVASAASSRAAPEETTPPGTSAIAPGAQDLGARCEPSFESRQMSRNVERRDGFVPRPPELPPETDAPSSS
jgi:hypothetical protein